MRGWRTVLIGSLALGTATALAAQRPEPVVASAVRPAAAHSSPATTSSLAAAQDVVAKTCVGCHSDRGRAGNLSLQSFDINTAADHPDVTEKMIRKLRAGLMPPAGARRPEESVLDGLADALEAQADARAETPSPGRRTFQRLNRAEYARSVHDLLALDVDAGDYLPLDTKSANFDNVADAQLLSPTLMQGYLTAAAELSRLAVGDKEATAREATYAVSRWASQREHVEGAPYGTRGGLSVQHTFPADGEYRFRVSFYHETTGALYGNGRAALHTAETPEQVEISIDGERVALLDVDR
jgi:mono/diheme cytochrome c family protein